ncbi:hypothetical protein UA08_08303 [Talaromyces atroroseus]|uniref:Uncharacterized protein n=1 Tax=Talaromyces atroroseus TaxID=1441469 RepID=A0A225AQ07_TALAT|nr:hypothetical protein UA08_08303 [Talaromyces atroroseus]OKL56515.1 hypothetical protein UA08_08303 [Talaromyces atroroseus]
MSQPSELPTGPVIGATVINESSATQPKKEGWQAQVPSCPITGSPTIQFLPEPTADFDPHIGAKPCSPFYAHDDNNTSLEYLKNEATIAAQRYGSNDLESGVPSTPRKRSLDVHGRVRCSKLWAEKKRRCDYLSSLTRRQRLIVKLVLALIIIGAMIGIAMGITVAVGGGVWKSANVKGTLGRLSYIPRQSFLNAFCLLLGVKRRKTCQKKDGPSTDYPDNHGSGLL